MILDQLFSLATYFGTGTHCMTWNHTFLQFYLHRTLVDPLFLFLKLFRSNVYYYVNHTWAQALPPDDIFVVIR